MAIEYDFEKYEDSSQRHDDPATWIAEAIAAYTSMMTRQIPTGLGKTTWSERRDALKAALIDVQKQIETMSVNEKTHTSKEYVYTLRSWFVEGILDFLFSDRRIWTSSKWTIEEVRKHTPKALALLVEDIKED